jgi:hypothetical protein
MPQLFRKTKRSELCFRNWASEHSAGLVAEYLGPMHNMSFETAQRLNGEFGIPWSAIAATCPVQITVGFTDTTQNFFQPDPMGVQAWVIPVTCVDPWRIEEIEARDPLRVVACGYIVDLLAFDPRCPRKFVLRTGLAPVLGVIEPQYCGPPVVRIFRDVTDWLKNQCEGLVLLTDDPFQAGRIIRRINAIAAEDAWHAEELRERLALPPYPRAFTTVISVARND